MKLQFDVTPQEFGIIEEILANNLTNNCQVWVFGSRAKNSTLFNSDLDLALECNHKIASKVLTQLKTDFEKSKLPYRVDVLNINTIEPYFQEIINKKKILFPFKAKNKVPRLRFAEFGGEWKDGNLGNYGNLINGLTYSPDNIVDDGLLVLRSSNVQNGQICLNDNVYVNFDVDDAALTREYDILICVRNGSKSLIGKSTIINKNLPKSTHGAFMTVFRGESNKFISHWFHSSIYYKEVHKNLGATINSINGSDLKKFKTIFPSKPEQQKIANFLTAIDTKIEQLSKKQALLSAYKKGAIQKIFSQIIRFHPKGISSLRSGQSDDGSAFPKWQEKRLNGVGKIRKGSQLNKSELTDTGDYPAINGGINPSGYTDKWNTEENTITISEGGNSCGYVNLIASKFWSGGHCYSIEDLKTNVLNKFLFQYLKFNEYLIMRLRVGSGLPNIQKGDINNFKVYLPYIEEQTKIANFLSAIDTKIKQMNQQLDKSKEFKKALLQQMFV